MSYPRSDPDNDLEVWCRDYPDAAAREIQGLREIVRDRMDLHRFDRNCLSGELEAMRPIVTAVRELRHADGLRPELIGNVMEAVERYEAWNV